MSDDPTYQGAAKAIHVRDDTFSVVPTNPLMGDGPPIYSGVSPKIWANDQSPSLDLASIVGPTYPYPVYTGRSQAIHVFGDIIFLPPNLDPCGITDDFRRTGDSVGRSSVGIDWVEIDGNTGLPGDAPGIAYTVADGYLVATATDVGTEYGSVDLPIPAPEFEAVFTLHSYPAQFLGSVNLQTPGAGAATAYIYFDSGFSNLFGVFDSANDDVSFTYDGRPLYVAVHYSNVATQAKIWYVGDTEPDWMVSLAAGDRSGSPAVSFEFDGFQANGDQIKVTNLEVFRFGLGDYTLYDPFNRSVASGGWGSTPGGDAWTANAHAAGLSVDGSDGVILDDESGTEVAQTGGGAWSFGQCRMRMLFQLRDAPNLGSPFVAHRASVFQVQVGTTEQVRLGITPDAGPPATGTEKSAISFNNAKTFIPPAFWVAGGEYELIIQKVGSTLIAAIAQTGAGQYEVFDSLTFEDVFDLHFEFFGDVSETNRIKVHSIEFAGFDRAAPIDACSEGSSAPCTTVFDDFQRSAGPNAWGTSTDLHVWELASPGVADVVHVDGTSGIFDFQALTSSNTQNLRTVADGPWANPDWVMQMPFTPHSVGDVSNADFDTPIPIRLYVGVNSDPVGSFSVYAGVQIYPFLSPSLGNSRLSLFQGAGEPPGAEYADDFDGWPGTWGPDEQYIIEWTHHETGKDELRAWPASGSRPNAWYMRMDGFVIDASYGWAIEAHESGSGESPTGLYSNQPVKDDIERIIFQFDCSNPLPGAGSNPVTFRPQLGDPTTTLDATVCLLESAAMVLEWQTHGGVKVWGGELVPWRGRDEASIRVNGTSLDNAQQAWGHYGQYLEIRAGRDWSDLVARLSEGRAVILGVLNAYMGAARCRGFDGSHAVAVLPFSNGSGYLVGDPLCATFKYVEASQLRYAAEALGIAFYGSQSPQPIYFGVSRPWT